MTPMRLLLFSVIALGLVAVFTWSWRKSALPPSPLKETQSDLSQATEPKSPSPPPALPDSIHAIPLPGPERVAAARATRGNVTAQRCRDAGLPYPPRELFFRAFK